VAATAQQITAEVTAMVAVVASGSDQADRKQPH